MFRLSKFVIILSAALAASSFDLRDGEVVMHLFTRSNPTTSEPLLPTMQSILQAMSLDFERPTVFTIHDYAESVTGNFNAFLVPAHLSRDLNVIAVDFSPGASLYTQALANGPQVGRIVALFINLMIENFGYQASQVSIVGHGVGAHIAGIAARNVIGNVPHIVAIDPALNGWAHHDQKLGPDAADLVEVLHATIGFYGYDEPLGHLDFYPNGGSVQSGCADGPCSYIFAYIYYAESVIADATDGATKFVGTKCENWQQATALSCNGESDVYFGGFEPKTAEPGVYFFLTNPLPPHARG